MEVHHLGDQPAADDPDPKPLGTILDARLCGTFHKRLAIARLGRQAAGRRRSRYLGGRAVEPRTMRRQLTVWRIGSPVSSPSIRLASVSTARRGQHLLRLGDGRQIDAGEPGHHHVVESDDRELRAAPGSPAGRHSREGRWRRGRWRRRRRSAVAAPSGSARRGASRSSRSSARSQWNDHGRQGRQPPSSGDSRPGGRGRWRPRRSDRRNRRSARDRARSGARWRSCAPRSSSARDDIAPIGRAGDEDRRAPDPRAGPAAAVEPPA